jgi:hypothetical protein
MEIDHAPIGCVRDPCIVIIFSRFVTNITGVCAVLRYFAAKGSSSGLGLNFKGTTLK